MATYVLIHGAGSHGSSWDFVRPLLEAAGHEVITPTLPSDDDSKTLADYAQTIVDEVGDRRGVILVAQSMGGLTAPLVVEPLQPSLLVYLCAMFPTPGVPTGEWWTHPEMASARRAFDVEEGRDPDADFDPMAVFAHDWPAEVLEWMADHPPREQSDTPFETPFPLDVLPSVPTEALIGSRDRFFAPAFMRNIYAERLGITPDEIDTGHVPSLAQPAELVMRLEAYRMKHAL